jgi:hypothetical protein
MRDLKLEKAYEYTCGHLGTRVDSVEAVTIRILQIAVAVLPVFTFRGITSFSDEFDE